MNGGGSCEGKVEVILMRDNVTPSGRGGIVGILRRVGSVLILTQGSIYLRSLSPPPPPLLPAPLYPVSVYIQPIAIYITTLTNRKRTKMGK